MNSLIVELLEPWVRQRRWFPAKNESGNFHFLHAYDLADPVQEAEVTVVLIRFVSATRQLDLHIPLVIVPRGGQAGEPVGFITHVGTDSTLLDGPHHPAFARAWLAEYAPHLLERYQVEDLEVHTGEQSNTSMIIPSRDASNSGGSSGMSGAILKVFRVLHPGLHPEVEVGEILSTHRWEHAPALLAASHIEVPGMSQPEATAVLTTQVSHAVDGFTLLTQAAAQEVNKTDDLHNLGHVIAQMHQLLARTVPAEKRHTNLQEDIRHRLATALNHISALDESRASLEELVATAPPLGDSLSRIHGDLHLGQLLFDGSWHVIDFEGEVMRPVELRRQGDHPLRDVVGILRSLDYAAAVAMQSDPTTQVPATWVTDHREAFLAGYFGSRRTETSAHLLALFELDRALYEAVYEYHNRPDWVEIPLSAIRRIIKENTMSAPSSGSASTPGPAPVPVDDSVLASVSEGQYFAPHDVLGGHITDGIVTIRTLRHLAESVKIRTAHAVYEATHEYGGIWVVAFAGQEVPDYRVEVTYDGVANLVDDPYRFLPTLGEMDQHLIAEGRHEKLWQVLGANIRRYASPLGEVQGTSFAVWAPNAQAVRVVGDFNSWDGRGHMMRSLGASGVWEIFIPDVGDGSIYKYELLIQDGRWITKADPLARATEMPPATGSIVCETAHQWRDSQWLEMRQEKNPHEGPMSIYEVHLGSWRKGLDYRQMAHQLAEYAAWMGFTHVELLPVAEHPYGPSWGYQVTGFYAPTSRFGSPDEFRYLVDTLHQAGIGVILDWVPAHFPKDAWALARFDGTPLYEHPDPQRGEHPDWGTLVFNYGRNEVRNFLVANALFWLEEFHIDGLRVDAVASMLYLDYSRQPGQWTPNARGGREHLEAISFLQELNATAYRNHPGIVMIAEESTAWPGVTAPTDTGGLGFGLKWNMGWMHDTLRYLAEEPINRRYHHAQLTFSLVYAFSEQYVLPLSHDEVVHGKGSLLTKMPGDRWQQLANLRALYTYMWCHPGKKLLFMGQEFGQESEWAEGQSLNWWLSDTPDHAGLRMLVKDLNHFYSASPALWDDSMAGFEWLEASDGDHNVIAFLRRRGAEVAVVVVNFAGTPHHNYRVGVPDSGTWTERLNSDAPLYGGSGVGNLGQVEAENIPWGGRAYSVNLQLPPLGAVILVPHR